jgi:hypothetical protein
MKPIFDFIDQKINEQIQDVDDELYFDLIIESEEFFILIEKLVKAHFTEQYLADKVRDIKQEIWDSMDYEEQYKYRKDNKWQEY